MASGYIDKKYVITAWGGAIFHPDLCENPLHILILPCYHDVVHDGHDALCDLTWSSIINVPGREDIRYVRTYFSVPHLRRRMACFLIHWSKQTHGVSPENLRGPWRVMWNTYIILLRSLEIILPSLEILFRSLEIPVAFPRNTFAFSRNNTRGVYMIF